MPISSTLAHVVHSAWAGFQPRRAETSQEFQRWTDSAPKWNGQLPCISSCKAVNKKLKFHENILKSEELVNKNYKIMQLYSPSISKIHKDQINFSLKEFEPKMEKLELMKKLHYDGINSASLNVLFNSMKKITSPK